MLPPDRVPSDAAVSEGPIGWKSPQLPVKSWSLVPNWFVVLQCASRNAWSPPQSCVRQTCEAPSKIVPGVTGSAIVGGYIRMDSPAGGPGKNWSPTQSHVFGSSPRKFTSSQPV